MNNLIAPNQSKIDDFALIKLSILSLDRPLIIAARDSKLSRAQVVEVFKDIPHPYECIWVKTKGDLDLKTSLRTLDKTDFFTKEIDQLLLDEKCDIAIHSAKDLPEPLPKGLKLVLLTAGLDPSDVLVFNHLPKYARIGSSSPRRDEMIKNFSSDFQIVDIRGTIEQRLTLVDSGDIDGVVMAEAALLRLNINRQRIKLNGPTAPLQGKLAIVTREDYEDFVFRDRSRC